MAKKTDSELFVVLSEPDKYQAEALAAARSEMKARNLSESEVENLKAAYELEQQKVEEKANKGLVFRDYAILLLPVVGIFIVSGLYRSEGYDKKAKQAAKIGVYYLAIILGFAILINLFS